MNLYTKGDYESMRNDAFEFEKEKDFNSFQLLGTRELLLDYFFYSRFDG